MIRAVWLGTTCLAVIGALAAGKALTTPAASERPAVETTTGIGPGEETLTKADRLEIAYVRPEPPARPLLQPSEPPLPAIRSAVPPAETKIVSRHWRDLNAHLIREARDRKSKRRYAKKDANGIPPKANAEASTCQLEGVDAIRRALKLATGCQS